MDFACRLDRREYHEEYWELYFKYYDPIVMERGENNETVLEAAHLSFEEFTDSYPLTRLDFYSWWEMLTEEQVAPTECPVCKEQQHKVMYMGLPGRLCKDAECSTMTGAASFIAAYLFFDGVVFFYIGSYWRALWSFLVDDDRPDPIDYN